MPLDRDDYLKSSNPIDLLWKNCSSMKQVIKKSETSQGSIFSRSINDVADLFDVVFNEPKKSEEKSAEINKLNKDQSEMLASLVPDLLITAKNRITAETTTFAGVILFIDISGFTAMCEKYAVSGTNGTDRMTMTLNRYLGPMVYEIYFHGGDVVKFAGDALLAVWKASLDEYTWSLVHNVIVCSKYIQHTCGSFQTDVGIILKVKASIAAGNLTFSVIGSPNYYQFIIYGPPVEEIKRAEQNCNAGEVLVAASAWRLCSKRNYYFEEKDDDVLILRIIYNPNDISLKFFEFYKRNLAGSIPEGSHLSINVKPTVVPTPLIDLHTSNLPGSIPEGSHLSNNVKPTVVPTPPIDLHTSKDTLVRPCLKTVHKTNIGKEIQGFIIGPVVQQIEAGQNLDYLTEMRTITTMFVNLIPKQKIDVNNLIRDVNEAYCIISKLVVQSFGSVNLVGLFDKDIMFLITFGLRGDEHEEETARGLKCAYSIRMALKNKDYVQSISVGVTCGLTYCGIVGHAVRKCYTVLGTTVNKAARFMCNYENKVTCDNQTFINSHFPKHQFILLETKQLKGINVIGNIYEYMGESRSEHVAEGFEQNNTILGHDKTIKFFRQNLHFLAFKCIIVVGDHGTGKTCLLKEFHKQTTNTSWNPVFLSISSYNTSHSYYVVQMIFEKILGPIMWRNKEIHLSNFMSSNQKHMLCFLNEVFQTNFEGDCKSKNNRKVMEAFNTLASAVCDKVVIIIDEAHHMDTESMPFIKEIINLHNSMVVMSMNKGDDQKSEFDKFVSSIEKRSIELNNLNKKKILPVCCQIMDVEALPSDIAKLILTRSNGNPGWCSNYLNYLIGVGKLVFDSRPLNDVQNDKEMLVILNTQGTKKKYKENEEIRIVIFERNAATESTLSSHICGMIMSTFDRLAPFEQVLLKCAAAMGMEFSVSQLIYALPELSMKELDEAIRHLFDLNILECKSTAEWKQREINRHGHHSLKNVCSCSENLKYSMSSFDNAQIITEYSFCPYLKFRVTIFQDKIYELMTINQSKIFHSKAFKYLQELDIKCSYCRTAENMKDHITDTQSKTWLQTAAIKSDPSKEFNLYKIMANHLSNDILDEIIPQLYKIKNFPICNCLTLKESFLKYMCHHGEKSDQNVRLVSIFLSYAEILIELGDYSESIIFLNKAFVLTDTEPSNPKRNMIYGWIYILSGQACLIHNDINDAQDYFEEGIKKLKKIRIIQSCAPLKYIYTNNVNTTKILNMEIIAFNMLCDVHYMKNNTELMQSFALKAFHSAMKMNFECNFFNLCLIYSNILMSFPRLNTKIRGLVLDFLGNDCLRNLHPLKLKEAVHIGIIYTAMFERERLQGKFSNETMKTGAIVLDIAYKFNFSEITCYILPQMIFTLCYGGYIYDAVATIFAYEKEITCDLTKYHSLCFELLLYAGIEAIPVNTSIQYAKNKVECNEPLTDRNRQLFVRVLLWYLRNMKLQDAKIWFEKLGPLSDLTVVNIVFDINYLQCFILDTVHQCNLNEISTIDTEAKLKQFLKFINMLENQFTPTNCIGQPKLLLLKSYVYKLSGDEKKSEACLIKAKNKSENSQNALMSAWIDHCKTVWNDPSHQSVNQWVEYSQSSNHMRWTEWNKESWPDIMYSLPLIMKE